jgi:hypothetical protein
MLVEFFINILGSAETTNGMAGKDSKEMLCTIEN